MSFRASLNDTALQARTIVDLIKHKAKLLAIELGPEAPIYVELSMPIYTNSYSSTGAELCRCITEELTDLGADMESTDVACEDTTDLEGFPLSRKLVITAIF